MDIFLGTQSQMKIDAFSEALNFVASEKISHFNLIPTQVDSGVPATPNESETYSGAKHRASILKDANKDGLYIGIESGLVTKEGILFEECWVVILDDTSEWVGVSSALQLPLEIINEMRKGSSHVDIINSLATRMSISNKDTWGVYSNAFLGRDRSIFEASRNALIAYLTDKS